MLDMSWEPSPSRELLELPEKEDKDGRRLSVPNLIKMFDTECDDSADQKVVEIQGMMVNDLMDNMEQVMVEKTREQQAPLVTEEGTRLVAIYYSENIFTKL